MQWPVGSKPHKCQSFLQLFPWFSCFFSLSSDINFFVWLSLSFLFLKRNHIWSWFSADTVTGGKDEADTNMRQAGRARGRLGSEHQSVSSSLQWGHGRSRAVEVHVLPLAVTAVPHAGLL